MSNQLRYTIRYSKGGINQYADVIYKDGVFAFHTFSPTWVKAAEVPSLEGLTDVNDILQVIKEFSFSKRAELYLIDGCPPAYYHNTEVRDAIKEYGAAYDKLVEETSLEFFKLYVQPVLKRKKWKITRSWCGMPVLIRKDESEESGWSNINERDKDNIMLEFMCSRFTRSAFNQGESVKLTGEHEPYISGHVAKLLSNIPNSEFVKLKLSVEL
jgi:hypothetical protein